MSGICVFGSLNIDLTVRLERFHVPGETVVGRSFHTFTGGKGGNQAVAAARLGGEARMIGCLGDDANGRLYRDALAREGVDASNVAALADETSGVALIEVDDAGENRIAIVAGANARLDARRVQRCADTARPLCGGSRRSEGAWPRRGGRGGVEGLHPNLRRAGAVRAGGGPRRGRSGDGATRRGADHWREQP